MTNTHGGRGGAECQGARLYAHGANVPPLDGFIMLCTTRFGIDAIGVEDVGTIYQRSWDAISGDGDRWRDGDRGAVALRRAARIKVVVTWIIARRILGQDHTFASWNCERAPEVEYLAPWERGMVVY